MGLKARATVDFFSVLKRLVGLLPRMNDEDKDRVFKFVHRADQAGSRPLELIFGAEQLLSKYDPHFALEKRGEAIESRLTALENAKKLRRGLEELKATEKRIAAEDANYYDKYVEINRRWAMVRLNNDPENYKRQPVNQWWGQRR